MSDKTQHLHILGICGTFMGGIAALAKELGFKEIYDMTDGFSMWNENE